MGEIGVRRARREDLPDVTRLLRASLGKQDDPHYEAFLHWKHELNPFGASPAWVALDGDRVVGYRTLLRWQFEGERGRVLPAVRAVDTATDPDYRGRGIFRLLTLEAVADLTRAGDAFVFNTPNDQSRPGYLSMGWSVVRRLPVGVLPSGPAGLSRMARARVPSLLWSEPTEVGVDAREVLADEHLCRALTSTVPQRGVRTHRTTAYLQWRVGFEPLRYRILWDDPAHPAQGGVVFRLRRRGVATEAVLAEVFMPSVPATLRLVRRLVAATGADYAIGLRNGPAAGLVPLPRQGPLLTARPLARSVPDASTWQLSMADIELF